MNVCLQSREERVEIVQRILVSNKHQQTYGTLFAFSGSHKKNRD